MPERYKWSVQLFGKLEPYPAGGYELAVIRNDHRHFGTSWGWGDEKKIILFGSGIGENQLNPCTPEQSARGRKIAEVVCEALNKMEANDDDTGTGA